MNNDILKEYFSEHKSLNIEPRTEFKQELINSLNRRITRLKQRQKCYSILLTISIVVMCGVFIGCLMSSIDIEIPVIEISPTYLLLISMIFTTIFITSYILNTIQIRELRRQLEILE